MDEAEPGTPQARVELGTGSHEADQGCMAEADGGAEGLKGTSGVRAEGMAGFSGACQRGRLGEEADSVMDRTGGDEEHFVLDGTVGDKNSEQSKISDKEYFVLDVTGDNKGSTLSGISDYKNTEGRFVGGQVEKHCLHFSVN